jgi:hypothetical protein
MTAKIHIFPGDYNLIRCTGKNGETWFRRIPRHPKPPEPCQRNKPTSRAKIISNQFSPDKRP